MYLLRYVLLHRTVHPIPQHHTHHLHGWSDLVPTVQGNKGYYHHIPATAIYAPSHYQLPSGWIPDVVILEGMFLIQVSPLSNMSCMQDYVKLLLFRFVRPHLVAGAKEVHIVFDVPGAQKKHKRR